LDRYGGEGDFLERIVMGNMDPPLWAKEWMPEYGIETSSLACQDKLKDTYNCRKAYAYSFWDSQGLLLEQYQESVQQCTVLATVECCVDKLKPAIRSEQWEPLSEGNVLLPNNAHPHTAAYTVETLQKLNFKVPEHLPMYSPDIVLLDYHLVGPFIQAWRGCRSTKDQQPQEMVNSRLDSAQNVSFRGHKEDCAAINKVHQKANDVLVRSLTLLQ
jgi:hypothetical protein